MPNTITKPSILTREVDSTDPRNFRFVTIDPLEIYGVKDAIARGIAGEPVKIADHPDFPNPRGIPRRDTVNDIKEAGALDTPVALYWTDKGDVVIADGKTRLTAIVEDLVENPDTDRWRRIPYIRVRSVDPNDVRIYMIKTNLEDSRTPLNDFEVGMAIDRLERSGVSETYIATALNKLGRGGIQYVRKLKDIINANPAVVDALRKGEIDLVTAAQIARRVGFREQAEAVARVVSEVEGGATEAEARKAAGVKGANRVTLGFKETYNYLVDNFYAPFRKILEKESDDPNYDRKIDWTNESQRMDYQDELIVRTAFKMSMMHLRQDGKSLKDQLRWIDENMSEEQKPMLATMRPVDKLTVLK